MQLTKEINGSIDRNSSIKEKFYHMNRRVNIMNTETRQEIIGIVMCHGENDYGYWGGFSLTEEEEEQIYEILMRHDTEGCSIRGTRNDIANEIKE